MLSRLVFKLFMVNLEEASFFVPLLLDLLHLLQHHLHLTICLYSVTMARMMMMMLMTTAMTKMMPLVLSKLATYSPCSP